MDEPLMWWMAASVLVVLELLTGTFYLLMLALGLVAGALAAHLGLGSTAQLLTAAVVGALAVWTGHVYKGKKLAGVSARAQRSVNLDIGETVHVDSWAPDGTATVKYRGAQWAAVLAPGARPEPGTFRVNELVGNRLQLENAS